MLHIVVMTLGTIASIGFISANFILNRKRMLYVFTFAVIVVSIQYSLLGALAVPVVNGILLIRNFVLLHKKWEPKRIVQIGFLTAVALTIATFLVAGVPKHSSGYLPLVASLFGAIAFSSLNITWIKSFCLLSSLSWVSLDIVYSNWQTLIGDAFSVLALLVALVRLKQISRRIIPEILS